MIYEWGQIFLEQDLKNRTCEIFTQTNFQRAISENSGLRSQYQTANIIPPPFPFIVILFLIPLAVSYTKLNEEMITVLIQNSSHSFSFLLKEHSAVQAIYQEKNHVV